MSDDIGTAMARKCTTTAALLAVLSERGFEAVPAAIGAAVDAVIKAHAGLRPQRSAPLDPAQAAFETAVLRLISVLSTTDPEPIERTPETVLRAMLGAYEAAALERAIASAKTPAHALSYALWRTEDLVDGVRVALAHCIASGGVFPGAGEAIERDYDARLSGERGLDAPPLEEP